MIAGIVVVQFPASTQLQLISPARETPTPYFIVLFQTENCVLTPRLCDQMPRQRLKTHGDGIMGCTSPSEAGTVLGKTNLKYLYAILLQNSLQDNLLQKMDTGDE